MSAKPRLDRDTALSARPERVPSVRCEDRDNGGTLVTLKLTRRRMFRWLGAPVEVEQSFGLDALGREVYDACDGKSSVKAIIKKFQTSRRVSRPEAEIAVTTFLKRLTAKGLVVMAVDKDRVKRKE